MNRLFDQFVRPFGIYAWFYRDALWRFRGRVIFIVVLDAASIALGGAVLFVVLQSVRALGRGEPVSLPLDVGSLDLRTPSGLVLSGIGLLILGVASAAALWLTQRLIKRTAADYQHACIVRTLVAASAGGPAPWAIDETGRSPAEVVNDCLSRSAMGLNQCVGWILESVRQAIMVILTAVTLCAIDALLVAILLPLLIIYLAQLGQLGREAQARDASYRTQRARFRRAGRAWINREPAEDRAAGSAPPSTLAALAADMTSALAHRRLIVAKSQFLNMLLLVAGIALIFGYYAFFMARDEADWAHLVAFVVVLRFFVSGLRNNAATLTRLHVYAARIRPSRRLLTGSELHTDIRPDDPAANEAIDAFTRSLLEAPAAAPNDDRVFVFAVPWTPTVHDFGLVEAALAMLWRARDGAIRVEIDRATAPAGGSETGRASILLKLAPDFEPTGEAPSAARRPRVDQPRTVLLLTPLKQPPAWLERRLDRQEPRGVIVWLDGRAHDAGSWAQYGERRDAYLAALDRAGIESRGSPDDDEDEDD